MEVSMAEPRLRLQFGGSREGTEYQFSGDADTLRQLALGILERLDGKRPSPWEGDPSLLVIEDIFVRRGLLFKREEPGFVSFRKANE